MKCWIVYCEIGKYYKHFDSGYIIVLVCQATSQNSVTKGSCKAQSVGALNGKSQP